MTAVENEAVAAQAETAPEPDAEHEGDPRTEDELDNELEPGPEPGPGPDAGARTEAEFRKAVQKLEAEATRHANRVGEIMGEDAQALEPCPLCLPHIPGFLWPGSVAPEQVPAVLQALGQDPEPEYATAEDARVCDACHGLGRVLTGSLVLDQRTKPCASCSGYGWIKVGGPTPPANHDQQQQVADDRPPLADDRPMDADPWGRKPGDPNYGRLPQYVGAA